MLHLVTVSNFTLYLSTWFAFICAPFCYLILTTDNNSEIISFRLFEFLSIKICLIACESISEYRRSMCFVIKDFQKYWKSSYAFKVSYTCQSETFFAILYPWAIIGNHISLSPSVSFSYYFHYSFITLSLSSTLFPSLSVSLPVSAFLSFGLNNTPQVFPV